MDSLLDTLLAGLSVSVVTMLISVAMRYYFETHPPKKRKIMIRSKISGDSITLEVGPGPCMTAEQHQAFDDAIEELSRRDANRRATA